MKNFMKIVLSGPIGSGKTTVGKMLSKHYNCEFSSAGSIARKEAERLGISIQEFQEKLIGTGDFDLNLDKLVNLWASQRESFVLDYRLGFKFLPSAISIFLDVLPIEAATRILKQRRNYEFKEDDSIESIMDSIVKRDKLVQERLILLYAVDYLDKNNYDFIIDVNSLSLDNVVKNIVEIIDLNT